MGVGGGNVKRRCDMGWWGGVGVFLVWEKERVEKEGSKGPATTRSWTEAGRVFRGLRCGSPDCASRQGRDARGKRGGMTGRPNGKQRCRAEARRCAEGG